MCYAPGWRDWIKAARPDRGDSGPATFSSTHKTLSRRQVRIEKRVERMFRIYFRDAITTFSKKLRRVVVDLNPEIAAMQSAMIISHLVDVAASYRDLMSVAESALAPVFMVGARSEQAMFEAEYKYTTAQSMAELLEDEIPDNISLGPYPDWMLEAASAEMRETFWHPYWQKMSENTWSDMQDVLTHGIVSGLSIPKIVDAIMESMPEYSRARAKRVAVTETGNLLNAGHAASMRQIEAELGFAIGKEWLSVLGSTTRPSHASLNAETTDSADGLFELSGYLIPWPSHSTLPAGERINCQCTIISAPLSEELFNNLEFSPQIAVG